MKDKYLFKKIKEHKKEILSLAIVLGIYLAGSILWLMMRGEIADDEFYSLRDTFGIFHTGKNLKWDFYSNAITNEPATWQLDFVLLAGWMHILGSTPLAMRVVSTIYGTLAVASFFYVARSFMQNSKWAFWASLLFAVNPIFVELSANIRGYTLLVFLNIWIYYWSYCALNSEKIKNACCYGVSALLFAYAAYKIRVFEVLYLCGIVIYIFIKACTTRKKRFIIMSSGVLFGIFLLVFAVKFHMVRYIPMYAMKWISVGWNNPKYILDLSKICWIYPVTAIGLFLCIWNLLKKNTFNTRQKDVIVYALSIVLSTMFLFLCVVDWMHDAKYLLAIHWAMILVITGGFYFFSKTVNEKRQGILEGIFICIIIANVYGNSVSALAQDEEKFAEAYGEIAEYIESAGMETPFFTGGEVREYYARDIFGEHMWEPLPEDDNEMYDHISDLSRIGKQHPRGIIIYEEKRMGGVTYNFDLLLKTDAFERITGIGLDESKISSWAYHIENLKEGKIEGEKSSIRFGYNYGGAIKTTEEDGKTVLELEINGSAPQKTIVCIKVNQFCGGESWKRYVQLILEPNGQSMQYYKIELQNKGKVEKSIIDETYYLYENEKEPQMFTDFYYIQ